MLSLLISGVKELRAEVKKRSVIFSIVGRAMKRPTSSLRSCRPDTDVSPTAGVATTFRKEAGMQGDETEDMEILAVSRR